MKLAVITDTHQGARGGSQTFREYFSWYYHEIFFPYLKENGINTILHLGDFFDNRNYVSIKDITYVMDHFIPLLEENNIKMYVIAGNHDLVYKNTNAISSLSILEQSKNVKVLKDNPEEFVFDGQRFVFVPWINNQNYNVFMQHLDNIEDKENTRVLGHFEIANFPMYRNSIPCEDGLSPKLFKDFKSVWSGHFHHPSKNANIEYLGALFHYNWQDYGDKRGFWVYDTQTDSKEYVENPFCLFTEIEYTDDLSMTDDEITEACRNQFVKIVINDEYDKVSFMDFHNKISSCKPLDVQITNNYAIVGGSDGERVDESKKETESKDVTDYIQSFIDSTVDDSGLKKRVQKEFDSVYARANELMVKGE